MDINMSRGASQTLHSFKLANGYILPKGKLTPNALFVGGIDMKVEENEIRDFFGRYGTVKEVKIITYRGGYCKGYGFVYFNDDVNIQSIIEQQINFKGRKLKLGPAILKERGSRLIPSRLTAPTSWVNPTQSYCACFSPIGGGVPQPSPILNGGNPYNQPYSYTNFGGVMIPQIPVNYVQNANPYAYQYTPPPWMADQWIQPVNQSFVDCGVQTMLTVL